MVYSSSGYTQEYTPALGWVQTPVLLSYQAPTFIKADPQGNARAGVIDWSEENEDEPWNSWITLALYRYDNSSGWSTTPHTIRFRSTTVAFA